MFGFFLLSSSDVVLLEKLALGNEAKAKAFSRKILAKLVTPQLKAMKTVEKCELSDLSGVTKEINPETAVPVMIRNCSGCSFKLTSNVVKLVLLECTDCSVVVAGRVLTGVLEIINCSQLNVAIVKALPTIQIDKSAQVTLGFVAPSLSGNIVISANTTLSIAPRKDLPPEAITLQEEATEYLQGMTQYMVRVQPDCSLLVERVVREGNGYATTQREKDAADLKDAAAEAAIVKFLSNMIK